MEKGWVGIDESNHGRSPEIYVAVFSIYPQDASPVIGLKKNRNKGNLDLILKERDFRFILIPECGTLRTNSFLNELIFYIMCRLCRHKEHIFV